MGKEVSVSHSAWLGVGENECDGEGGAVSRSIMSGSRSELVGVAVLDGGESGGFDGIGNEKDVLRRVFSFRYPSERYFAVLIFLPGFLQKFAGRFDGRY
jgi:hypothetical protein